MKGGGGAWDGAGSCPIYGGKGLVAAAAWVWGRGMGWGWQLPHIWWEGAGGSCCMGVGVAGDGWGRGWGQQFPHTGNMGAVAAAA